MRHLENLTVRYLQKAPDSIRTRTWSSFPPDAVREVLANALHHRSYDVDRPDPTKVYLFPDRKEIASYPGPVPGIESKHFLPGASPPPALLARNRRIGEFFKELRLVEQRFSGLPRFSARWRTTARLRPPSASTKVAPSSRQRCPAHPEYVALSALRDAGELRTLGEDADALRRLDAAWKARPESEVLTSELVRVCVEQGNTRRAHQVLATFRGTGDRGSALARRQEDGRRSGRHREGASSPTAARAVRLRRIRRSGGRGLLRSNGPRTGVACEQLRASFWGRATGKRPAATGKRVAGACGNRTHPPGF